MAAGKVFLAFDLGAESGRAVTGSIRDGHLSLEVVHRFANTPVRVVGSLHWDALRLFHEMKEGLRAAAREHQITSLGVDTWGVDSALLDQHGMLLCNPWHYRDSRTDGVMDEVISLVGLKTIFEETGIQFLPFNTLYQLYSLKRQNPRLLELVEKIILVPDLFNYWFTGEAVCEFTEATTSQAFNPRTGQWSDVLFNKLGLPGTSKMGNIVQPGTQVGSLISEIAEDCNCPSIPVIAPATHDTGSAVAAVPATDKGFAYISSGTWSLVGVEVSEPVITEKSLEYNFTNEGGVEGTYRLLKNVMGLWIVQECRRTWEKEGISYDYARLTEMASEEPAFVSLIDPDNAVFLPPGDMPTRVRDFCKRTGQKIPETPAAIVRTVLDSLAMRYRWVVERLEELTGSPINRIHVVGGGTQNRLLQQLTADVSGRETIAGPVEATAIGNILMQAIGMKEVSSLMDARSIVKFSFDLNTYTPGSVSSDQVVEAYDRWTNLL